MTVPSPRPGDEASLAAHARFLRGLARGLLFDRSSADDVAQRALLVALEKQRRGEGKGDAAGGFSLRAWLAGVVRNLARQEGRDARRRATREQVVARPERTEAAVDSVARLELTQRVVAAVRALEEPYRTVVVLRWFDGLKPGAIAKRTGAPVETVRTRLKRALEQLRQKLDGQHGGDRAQWGLLLLPTALPTAGGIAGGVATSVTFHALALGGVGAVAISTKAKVVAAAAAALAAAALLFGTFDLGAPPAKRPRSDGASDGFASAPAATGDAASPRTDGEVADATRATRAELATEPTIAAPAGPLVLRATTLVADDGPTAGLRVRARLFDGYEAVGEPLAEAELVSGEGGLLAWEHAPPAATATLLLASAGDELLLGETSHLLYVGEAPLELELTFTRLDAVIVGKVVDDHGAPLPDAQVQSFWSGQACPCDENGEYRVRASSAWGQWALAAWAPGFAEATGSATTRGPGSTTTIDFRLHADFAIRGRITDESGAPVGGAKVTTLRAHFNHVASDADGRYEMRGLDPQVPRVELHVDHPGFAPLDAVVLGAGGDATHDFVLARGARVEGIVLAPDGAPMRGVPLWIGSQRHVFGAPTTRSRDDGRFSFRHLAPGEHPLGGEAAGYPTATTRIVVPPATDRVAGVELHFARGRFLAGVVRDPAGAPIAGAIVAASRDGSSFLLHARTDAEGRFRLEALPEPPLLLMASAPGCVARTEPCAALDRDDLELVIARAGKLAGRVVDAESGEPVKSFRIRFVQPHLEAGEQQGSGYEMTWSQPGRAFTTEDGTWRCDGEAIEPGALFAIEATAAGYAPAIAPRVACALEPAPDDCVLRLSRGARVEGRVVGDDGRPVAGAFVTLATPSVPLLPYQRIERDARWIVRSDETGAFAIDGAPAGACTLVVDHPDWIGAVDGPFEVPERGRPSPRTIALARGGRIVGVLLDAAGQPEAGRQVTLYPATNDGPFARMETTTTDTAGRFEFGRLATATWQVSSQLVAGPITVNELSARVALVAPAAVELRLAPSGSARVRGRIVTARPLPAAVEVSLHRVDPPADAEPMGLLADRATFAVDGAFDFAALPPGRWSVNGSCYVEATREWINAATEAVVGDGESVEVVLKFEER